MKEYSKCNRLLHKLERNRNISTPLCKMDLSSDRYYKFNRIVLSAIGLWPHRYITFRPIQNIILLFILISVIIPQYAKLITAKHDMNIIIKVLAKILPSILFTVKYITFYFNTEDIKKLMQEIQNDWNTLKDNTELEIIKRYSKMGKLLTMYTAALIFICKVIILYIQFAPSFFNILAPQNEYQRTELFEVEYFVDQEIYYYAIQFHLDVGLFFGIITMHSTETFSVLLAIHAFGMFKIASYRMEHIIDENESNIFTKKHCTFYNNLVAAVNSHKRAIEFCDNMKSTLMIPYLALISLGVSSASVNLYLFFQIITTTNPIGDILISIIYTFWNFVYMFGGNYFGQQFVDHNAEIYEKICNIQWYNISLRSQKEILFIMQRASKNYYMKIGCLYTPSLEGFTMLLSTTLTYFTVLCSIRKDI